MICDISLACALGAEWVELYTICLIVRQLFKSLSIINSNYDAWPSSNYSHAINMLEVLLEHKVSLSSTKVSTDSRMCITVTIDG